MKTNVNQISNAIFVTLYYLFWRMLTPNDGEFFEERSTTNDTCTWSLALASLYSEIYTRTWQIFVSQVQECHLRKIPLKEYVLDFTSVWIDQYYISKLSKARDEGQC